MNLAAWTLDTSRKIAKRVLPRGIAWGVDWNDPHRLENALDAMLEEVRLVQAAFLGLIDEADWRTTDELLEDWERIAGLPDDCAPEPADDDERRSILHARMTATGGQTADYYTGVAETLLGAEGEITVEDLEAFRVGRNATGDPLAGSDWDFAWLLTVYNWTFPDGFHVGEDTVGYPVGPWGPYQNGHLECLIARIKPSHTIARVGYTADAPPT